MEMNLRLLCTLPICWVSTVHKQVLEVSKFLYIVHDLSFTVNCFQDHSEFLHFNTHTLATLWIVLHNAIVYHIFSKKKKVYRFSKYSSWTLLCPVTQIPSVFQCEIFIMNISFTSSLSLVVNVQIGKKKKKKSYSSELCSESHLFKCSAICGSESMLIFSCCIT